MKEEDKILSATEKDHSDTLTMNQAAYRYPLLLIMLPFLSTLLIMIKGILMNSALTAIAKSSVVALVLTGAVTFYIRSYQEGILKKKYAGTLISVAYLGSVGLLMIVPNPGNTYIWMLGGLFVAMLFDNRLGMFINFNLAFILGIMIHIKLSNIILILIICVLLSILSGAVKEKSALFYAMVIILAVHVTLTCAINNFVFEKIANLSYAISLLLTVVTLLAAYILASVYQKKIPDQNNTETITDILVRDNLQSIGEQAQDVKKSSDTNAEVEKEEPKEVTIAAYETVSLNHRTSYEVLCDPNNLLLQKLRENSESLYHHAMQIGDLSERAAKIIGANEYLSKAGGLYHEIGKINGKNYIEEGLKIAEDYSFPKELTAILREHNIKYDKPSSVEAAIVMLSDNVISTIEYIEKTRDHKFTRSKIIENIFQMRLDKGTFDSAGISLKDYKALKEFYQAEFNKPDNE